MVMVQANTYFKPVSDATWGNLIPIDPPTL